MPTASNLPLSAAGPGEGGSFQFTVDPARLDGILWRRPFAYFVDAAIVCLIYWLAFALLSPLWVISLGTLTAPIFLLLAVIPVAYHSLLIGSSASATFGQRLFGIEVRRIDGRRPTLGQAVVQTILFYVSVTLATPVILAVMLFNRQRRTLHDYLAGTLTLRAQRGPEILPPDQPA